MCYHVSDPCYSYIEVQEDVKDVANSVNEILQRHHNEEEVNMLQWLTPIEYGLQQHDFHSRCQPGTGQWLLNTKEFQDWENTEQQTLACHGMPGSGKTFLTSIVLDHFLSKHKSNSTIGIAYIYCDFRQRGQPGTQKFDDILASLVKQLARGTTPLPATLKNLYHTHQARKTRPSSKELVEVLQAIVVPSSKTFIILDALDELSGDCRRKLLNTIFQIQTQTNLNIFTTSRPTLEINRDFQNCVSHIPLEIRAQDEDVQNYLESRRPELTKSLPGDTWEDVKNTIVNAAEGMYVTYSLPMNQAKGN